MKTALIFQRNGDVPPMDWFGMGCFAQGILPTQIDHTAFDERGADLVAIGGNLRRYNGANQKIFEFYRTRGTPVFVIETGRLTFLKMGRYWFLYFNRVPMLPDVPDFFSSRRRRMIFPPVEFLPKRGDHILVVGQTSSFDKDIERNVVPAIRKYTDRPIIWRPRRGHSLPHTCNGIVDIISDEPNPKKDLERAWAVVTHSSNMGGEALMLGIPVFCDPCATYAEYAHQNLLGIHEAERPLPEHVEHYLIRLSQITVSDMDLKRGDQTRWILDHETLFSRVPGAAQQPSIFADVGSTDKSKSLTLG